MKVNEVDILNYLDRKRDNQSNAELEKLLDDNEELREMVQAIEASQLPYKAAFSAQKIPDMPEQLYSRLSELSQNSNHSTYIESEETYSTISKDMQAHTRPNKFNWSIAAGICLAFITGSLTTIGINNFSTNSQQQQLAHYAPNDLINSMIQYQSLYTRDTIKAVKQDIDKAEVVIAEFNDAGSHNVELAELSNFNYEFRRAQKLAHHDQTIIQVVYLAEQGKPLALCITRGKMRSLNPMHYHYADMNTLMWTHENVTYMLMGDVSKTELKLIYDSLTG